MTRLRLLAAAAAAALTIGTATAGNAVTIDFNAQTSNDVAALTIGAVTFTAEGGGTLFTTAFGNTPNGTVGVVARSAAGALVPTRATIAGGTSSVSIDLGDYNADDDSLFLRLYDINDMLLATATDFIPASFTGMVTLSASAPGTAYAIFGGIGFAGESNVYGDNFTFAAVPEPMTWALMIGGFGACGTALRVRRRTLAAA